MSDYLVSQLFSAAPLVLGAIAYLSAGDRRLRLILSAAATSQAIHFAFLGATQGFVQSLVTASRFFISAWWQNAHFFWLFLALGTGVGVWRYQGASDLLPILANAIACVSVFRFTGLRTRYGLLGTTVCWLTYNALHLSLVGCLLELFYIATNVITIRRMARQTEHRS